MARAIKHIKAGLLHVEVIAMDLEKYGDVRVLSVEVHGPEQMRMASDWTPERN